MTICRRPGCGTAIEFARTEAGQSMPMDVQDYPAEDERANLATWRDGLGRTTCRVITAERPLMGWERRRMPHWATCSTLAAEHDAKQADAQLGDNVLPFPTATARARARKDPRP